MRDNEKIQIVRTQFAIIESTSPWMTEEKKKHEKHTPKKTSCEIDRFKNKNSEKTEKSTKKGQNINSIIDTKNAFAQPHGCRMSAHNVSVQNNYMKTGRAIADVEK